MLIKWDDSFKVNIKKFDQQHQKLVKIINKLNEIYLDSDNKNKIKEILNKLQDYAQSHLEDEEKMFRQYKYPDAEAHIKTHDFYRKTIKKYIKEIRNNDYDISVDVMNFLKKWWQGHILTTDKMYSQFFKDKNLN